MHPSSDPNDLLEAERLAERFAGLKGAARILVAVSGGPDSIALMHLLARWADAGALPSISVATVDHGLRPEAAAEAAFVAREAAVLNLPHRTLAWTGPKPATGLQESARKARYDLLLQHARSEGASHLLTAHTLDDQAETVLMRLAHGSGLSGLAGMRAERDREGIRHARPLLDCPKAVLLDLCARQGWAYVTDPSNADGRFARVRWRRLMPALEAEGLTAGRLAGFARRALRAEEALDAKAREALARARPVACPEGLGLDAGPLAEEPFEIALRLLAQGLEQAGMSLDNSRLQRLETCTERLRQALSRGEEVRLTVVGALVSLDRRKRLVIGPEPPRRRGR